MAISRWRGGRSLTTWSPIKTLPALMSSRPAIMRRAVDFPHPDGPTKTTNSPSGISRFILSTATTSSPKTLVTSSMVTSAIPLPPSAYPDGSVVRDPLSAFLGSYTPVPGTFYMLLARPAQVVSLLDLEYALDGLLDARSRYLPSLDGGHYGVVSVDLLPRRTGDYEEISPRLDGLDSGLGHSSSTPGPGHRQIIGYDHTVKVEISTQHAYGIL